MTENRIGEATLALDETTLQAVRTRRCGGESLKTLAAEAGQRAERDQPEATSKGPAGVLAGAGGEVAGIARIASFFNVVKEFAYFAIGF